ncbi:hypothetical protein MKW98_015050, partial [Papaver atlanticum]
LNGIQIHGVAEPQEPQPVDGIEEPNANQEPQPVDGIEEPNANQEAQTAVDIENDLKFALGLFTASAGSTVAAIAAGFKGKAVSHPVAFHAFASLILIALITDSIAILLGLKRPFISHLARIVRYTLCVSLTSLIFADIWAVSFVLIGNLTGRIVAVVFLSVFITASIIVSVVL